MTTIIVSFPTPRHNHAIMKFVSGKTMTSALKDICLHLDNVVSEFFGIAQELSDTQTEINELIADGCILMAKVRLNLIINYTWFELTSLTNDNSVVFLKRKITENY